MRGSRRSDHYLDGVGAELTRYEFDEFGNYHFLTEDGDTRADLLERMAEEKSRLDAIGNVYQTADKIISGDDITVTVSNNKEMDTHATNNGREIIFNSNLIEDLDNQTIVSMNGANYHELSHILFSPRAGSSLGQHVTSNKMKRAFNILEEARAEKLLVTKYPSTRLFLEANVLEYALKGDPDEWGDMFPVVTGRRYLDIDIRQMIADKFIEKYGLELATNVHSIVNEYRSLSFPTDFTRGMELITEFTKIVGLDTEPPKRSPQDGGDNHNGRPVPTKGRPENGKEQSRLQEKKDGNVGLVETLEGGEPKDSETNEQGGEPNHSVGGDATDEMDVKQKQYSDEDNAIAKLLNDRMKDIITNPKVTNEVRETRKAITGNDDVRGTLKSTSHFDRVVSPDSKNFARRFGTELERMVRDSDPSWDKFLPSGKLNISRTMNPDINAIGQMFDVWDTGNSNTDIESVILLDNSGSMGYYMNEVCEKAWIIKRGIETIDGNVTVYNFHSWSELLYDKSEKAKPLTHRSMYARGSTNPMTALIEAERILTNSDKSIKLLFIVTDGEWENNGDCDSIIARLNKKGVTTCVVFMGDVKHIKNLIADSRNGEPYAVQTLRKLRHNSTIFKAVTRPRDVLEVAVDIVKSRVGK
jgi:hypothetical protein